MGFGCSKEPSHCDGSFEYPQNMFQLRNKKIDLLLYTLFRSTIKCVNDLMLVNRVNPDRKKLHFAAIFHGLRQNQSAGAVI